MSWSTPGGGRWHVDPLSWGGALPVLYLGPWTVLRCFRQERGATLLRLFSLISLQSHTAARTPLTTTWNDVGGFRYPYVRHPAIPGVVSGNGSTGLPSPYLTTHQLRAARAPSCLRVSCRSRRRTPRTCPLSALGPLPSLGGVTSGVMLPSYQGTGALDQPPGSRPLSFSHPQTQDRVVVPVSCFSSACHILVTQSWSASCLRPWAGK